MPKYSKTVRAFLAEEGTLWDVVDALSQEMPGHVSATDLGECQSYLADHGIEKSTTAIKWYRITGRFVEESTKPQQELFRSQSVTTIKEFARYGASQEAAFDAIVRYQRESSKQRMGAHLAAALFQGPNRTSADADPDEWTDDQWAKFDAKVVAATRTVLTALNTWQRGIYTPSVEALAQLALLKPADLDAELASLLGE